MNNINNTNNIIKNAKKKWSPIQTKFTIDIYNKTLYKIYIHIYIRSTYDRKLSDSQTDRHTNR